MQERRNFELPADELRNATITVVRDGATIKYVFDDNGDPVQDERDATATLFMPTNGRVHDGNAPVQKHREAWASVLAVISTGGKRSSPDETKAANAIGTALGAVPDAWVTVDVPGTIALRIVRGEFA